MPKPGRSGSVIFPSDGMTAYSRDYVPLDPATFRHSYRSWMDDTGAPLTVQKELMRHASIQTTMNVYGKAMTDTKRHAHSKVVEPVAAIGREGEFAVRSKAHVIC
jgi:integrase